MAEEFADDVEVAAAHDQLTCERMSNIVPTEIRDARFPQELAPSGVDVGEAAAIT